MVCVAGSLDGHKNLDYIACFFLKAAAYVRQTNAAVAFVATNSICQGEQVALLWPQILNKGSEIRFAHTSFKWTNNAKGNAGVTCVIIGLGPKSSSPKALYSATHKKLVGHISGYLIHASDIYPEKRSIPLSNLPEMTLGNMAKDGGHLFLERDAKDNLLTNFPEAKKFVRRVLGSQEYVRGEMRWCLWIPDELAAEAALIPSIRKRLESVALMRSESVKGGTQGFAKFPHRFVERRHQEAYAIIVPRVTSERRHFLQNGYITKDTIITDLAYAIYHAEPWVFGVISSQMHMVWVRAVAGRLKTDYRYSSTICYNSFPFPEISAEQKRELDQLAEEVLGVREDYHVKTIALLYNPETMPAALLAAHRALDAAIERCYRTKPFTSDDERLEYLFAEYERMTAAEAADLFTPAPAKRAKKRGRK